MVIPVTLSLGPSPHGGRACRTCPLHQIWATTRGGCSPCVLERLADVSPGTFNRNPQAPPSQCGDAAEPRATPPDPMVRFGHVAFLYPKRRGTRSDLACLACSCKPKPPRRLRHQCRWRSGPESPLRSSRPLTPKQRYEPCQPTRLPCLKAPRQVHQVRARTFRWRTPCPQAPFQRLGFWRVGMVVAHHTHQAVGDLHGKLDVPLGRDVMVRVERREVRHKVPLAWS